ncbi:alpha/beta hydrolase [Clostridium acetobutylicum]|uniref:Alpha/beta superfamily hydrolase n=2 Tax=Clostridiaceae TaxID=31979 RepID=Q97D17_CLOAB|nr:Alpha/beta superfamily hydrolase [Clostridium acetobutylicum ATCC 824]AEI32980.1 alpha/beta fold family hydrolase [Clostridium acetobutylicum DSM 1731]AWV80739.1 alpha/beta hydrolase [Clostridium acetobutylicum]PSM05328.1 alpha/beta hydrolase [Clostridium sp. NJ4]MBC2393936.1 alpha/beta hydrolase [Clostridium acetobutylicum]
MWGKIIMQKSVEIKSKSLTLRGVLHMPLEAREKLPIVVIYHGFCGNKMGPHFIFVKLARELEKLGIATIRFDFAGTGESDGEFVDMTFSNEVYDANVILDYVKTLEFVDKDRISILGFSMGGAIASVIAGDRKDEINTLCLWAPAGNMEQIILSDTYIGDKYDEIMEKGIYDVEGLLLGKKFLEDIKKVNIFDRASAYNKQSLIIHGTSDEIVPLSTSERYLEMYGENTSLELVEGANHIFEKNSWENRVIDLTKKYFSGKLVKF